MSASLAEELRDEAEAFAAAGRELGYALDFSPGSAAEVERLIRERWSGWRGRIRHEHRRNGPAGVGAYLGELLVRNDGGRWEHWEGEKKATVAVVFERQDFAAFPVDKATKRVWRPREHDLVAFVETVRRELRGPAAPTEPPAAS